MASLPHKIKASLYLNWLTEDPNNYSATVASERSLNITAISNAAVNRCGAHTMAKVMEYK